MPPAREFHLSPATALAAHAKGAPGKRTFYLDLASATTHARVWLEKEEMLALGLAIQRLAVELGEAPEPTEGDIAEAARQLATDPTIECRARQLSMSYDQRQGILTLLIEGQHPSQSAPGPDDPPQAEDPPIKLSCATPLAPMRALAQRIEVVCAAGRPLCPVCHTPIDPEGHTCLRRNGYQPAPPQS